MREEINLDISDYYRRLSFVYDQLNFQDIQNVVTEILNCRSRGGTVAVAGNGGSASLAEHACLDWAFGSKLVEPPLKTLPLLSSTAYVTATSNDLSFAETVSRLVANQLSENDLLILFSASGNSENLITGATFAKKLGIQTIAIVGFDGGKLKKICNKYIHIETELGEYGIVEDVQLSICHSITEFLRLNYA